MEKEFLKQEAETLTNQPYKIHKKLKRKKFFGIEYGPKAIDYEAVQPCMLAVERASAIILGVADIQQDKLAFTTVADIFRMLGTSGKAAREVLAAFIENTGDVPNKQLVDALGRNFTISEITDHIGELVRYAKLEDFLRTIILLKGMSLNQKEEIIAASTPTSSSVT